MLPASVYYKYTATDGGRPRISQTVGIRIFKDVQNFKIMGKVLLKSLLPKKWTWAPLYIQEGDCCTGYLILNQM